MPDALELRLGWVIVYVDEPAAASEFYGRAFGLRAEFVAGSGTYAQLDTGPTRLAFAAYGQRVAYVRDPFGTLVELATPI
jgi:catechol 2,3-dioxygenase-like lactoylglutathione lyase family enzyme